MRTERGSDVIIMLVGNKTDLAEKRYLVRPPARASFESILMKSLISAANTAFLREQGTFVPCAF